MALDFEKAFDSVSHFFLYKVLNSFGFGPLFCKWVNILYTNTESCVMNGMHQQVILRLKEELDKETHYLHTCSFYALKF